MIPLGINGIYLNEFVSVYYIESNSVLNKHVYKQLQHHYPTITIISIINPTGIRTLKA